jgi:transcription initiation factor TFIIH subunit 3
MSNNSTSALIQDRSFLILIIDLTPHTWGQRNQDRILSDKTRSAQNKRSVGPAILEEVLESLLSFLVAFTCCHRDNAAVVIGVAGSEVAVLHPRKNRLDNLMSISSLDKSADLVETREGIFLGVAELMSRSAEKHSNSGTSMAAALSMALCLVNRLFRLYSRGNDVNSTGDSDRNSSLLYRKQDDGILSLISNKMNKEGEGATKYASEQRLAQRRARGMLSPRILIVQASEDCTMDYNSFMNCVFAANKNDVVIDGCFIASMAKDCPKTSTFLEQACDRTGGVFSKPAGGAQVGGGLTEIFMTVFLPPLGIRKQLNLPKVSKVDFRARCFETGASLDMGMVCNLCLSIFSEEPKGGYCLTCGAKICKRRDGLSSSSSLLLPSSHQKKNVLVDEGEDKKSKKFKVG